MARVFLYHPCVDYRIPHARDPTTFFRAARRSAHAAGGALSPRTLGTDSPILGTVNTHLPFSGITRAQVAAYREDAEEGRRAAAIECARLREVVSEARATARDEQRAVQHWCAALLVRSTRRSHGLALASRAFGRWRAVSVSDVITSS